MTEPPSLKQFLIKASDSVRDAPAEMVGSERSLRVMLIQPPTTGAVRSLLPQVDEGEGIGYKPPLGLLYLGTMLKERSRHEVKLVDAVASQQSFEQVVEVARQFRPDVIGLSAWTDFWWPCHETGRLLRQALPQAHICIGGPHVGIYPEETLAIDFVDSVVVGDGEVPFLFLCNMLANNMLSGAFPGLHIKAHGVKSSATERAYVHGNLDDLPIPDRTLLDPGLYGSVLSKGSRVTTMITSRGCPHRCTFCKLNFQKTLARSAESVVAEFRRIRRLGIDEVEIYDDTFTWGRDRLRQICEGLIEADLGISWAIRDRVSKVDPEMLALMYRAGCRRVHYGIESGVQNVLDRMRKQITVEQAAHAVMAAKAAGMTVLAYFMFGNLDETVEDMEATVRFARHLAPHYAEFSITIPYAGTEMYDEAVAKGLINADFWRDYARAPTAFFEVPAVIESNASLAQLKEIQRRAIRSFYFRPRYLVRELIRLSSFREFVRKARMGMRLAASVYTR